MKKNILSIIFLLTIFVSCTKEGPQGPAGTNGNANVISSNPIILSGWGTDYDDGNNFSYSVLANWSAITQEIKDKGIVMVYLKDNNSDWFALPWSTSDNTYSDSFLFVVGTGHVEITYSGFDNSGSVGASSLNNQITARIVAIPSSVVQSHPNTNWNNYYEVMAIENAK